MRRACAAKKVLHLLTTGTLGFQLHLEGAQEKNANGGT